MISSIIPWERNTKTTTHAHRFDDVSVRGIEVGPVCHPFRKANCGIREVPYHAAILPKGKPGASSDWSEEFEWPRPLNRVGSPALRYFSALSTGTTDHLYRDPVAVASCASTSLDTESPTVTSYFSLSCDLPAPSVTYISSSNPPGREQTCDGPSSRIILGTYCTSLPMSTHVQVPTRIRHARILKGVFNGPLITLGSKFFTGIQG